MFKCKSNAIMTCLTGFYFELKTKIILLLKKDNKVPLSITLRLIKKILEFKVIQLVTYSAIL